MDFNVYGTKQFTRLWNTQGLKSSGVGHMNNVNAGFDDTMNCLKYWFCTLYDKSETDFQTLSNAVQTKKDDCIEKFLKESPDSYISPADLYQLIPEEIDLLFGDYMMDFEILGNIDEMPILKSKKKLVPQRPRGSYLTGIYANLDRLPF